MFDLANEFQRLIYLVLIPWNIDSKLFEWYSNPLFSSIGSENLKIVDSCQKSRIYGVIDDVKPGPRKLHTVENFLTPKSESNNPESKDI